MFPSADRQLTSESILQLLQKNDLAVIRACMVLFQRQTASEQQSHSTQVSNGIGFNAADAGVLSAVAKRGLRQQQIPTNLMNDARYRIQKYAGQLLEIAVDKQIQSMMTAGQEKKGK